MALIETWYNQDLQSPVVVHHLHGNVFSQDNQGNLIGVNVFDGGSPATLSGTVTAYAIRADGATVPVNGVLNGNSCYAILNSACYEVEGTLSIVIKLSGSGSTTTLCAVVAYVYKSITDTAVDPSSVIPSVQDLIEAIDEAVASIPADYSALWRAVDESVSDSINEYDEITLADITLGKTLFSGVYSDAPAGLTDKRSATEAYYYSGDFLKIVTLAGYKTEIDFYNENKTFIGYYGWLTGTNIIKPLGKYFRIISAGDTDITSVYETITTVYSQSYLYDTNRRTDELNTVVGGSVNLPAWIVGKFPHFSSDEIWSNADYKYAQKVRVVSGAKYRFTGVFNSVCGAIFYDVNNSIISGAGINSNEFIVPDNAVYMDIGTLGVDTKADLFFVPSSISAVSDKGKELEIVETSGVITPALVVNADTGARVDIEVKPNEQYLISSYCYITGVYPIVIYLNGNTLVKYENLAEGGNYVTDALTVVPAGANRMIINGKPLEIKIKKVPASLEEAITDIYQQIRNTNVFEGKTIVWFGTSIPAGGWFGYEHPFSYPQRVGRLLGANVINEAIGSSCMHCKDPARISANNPYGFKGGFESSSRCLTNSLEEANWIIDHWNSDIWTSGVPSEMNDWLKGKIRGFGYEEKVDKYLTPETFPDLFVFDHGYNDSSDVNNYYDTYGRYNLYTFRGAMNFIIKRILDYNPNANIVIIGNYTTTRDVPQMQETVARDWAIPICKQWEDLGLSMTEYVTADGYWSESGGDYTWVQDGTDRTYTMKDRLIPDGIHPHSDPTGKVVKKMAQNLAKWFLSCVPLYD